MSSINPTGGAGAGKVGLPDLRKAEAPPAPTEAAKPPEAETPKPAKKEVASTFEGTKPAKAPGTELRPGPLSKNPGAPKPTRERPEDPLVGTFAASRTTRATPPSPVEHEGKKWDVAGIVMKDGEPHAQLQEAGVQPRYMPMVEVLKGRVVEFPDDKGVLEKYRLIGTRQTKDSETGKPTEVLVLHKLADSAEPVPLRTQQPARGYPIRNRPLSAAPAVNLSKDKEVLVPMSAADKVLFTFNTGDRTPSDRHTYSLGVMRYDSFLLTPQEPAQTKYVPLESLGKVEARLSGREMEGVYTLEATANGGIQASGMDKDGHTGTSAIQPSAVAGRYVLVPAPDFGGVVALDAFNFAEAKARATAATHATEGSRPISDPLIGTLPTTVRAQVDRGTASLQHIKKLLDDPKATGPVTLFNVDLGIGGKGATEEGNNHAQAVLDSLVAYRTRNPDAPMQVIADERMWNNREMNKDLTTRLQDAGIDIVFPRSTAKPRINHSKGACVGERVVLTTAAVVPKTTTKSDITTELPPEAAGLYRDYLSLTFKTGEFTSADKEKLESLVAGLAKHGVVANDPMTKIPMVARAMDGLITGATRSLRFLGSELKDVDTAQKFIDQAKAGVQVLIQYREIDPQSESMLKAAMKDLPHLKLEKVDDWKPYPHFNALIADDSQAYVGTAYLWPNQLSMAHHGLSHESGVVLGEDSVKDLLRQFDDLEAKTRPA
ncbi:long-chain-fatty-acid--CoA ligase [Myxococcus stipitatus DSM 14675]|uniref:Long-chain-fatty-acid--CoA ligase n=1 Tax=Myxococcus stipitatus (strain DSM 14675 / JCM 12634 / Mx s8) TaxID=1278073 RepID=L7U3Q0_MYXSD|nr:long-chain-fatty-acid--CoA ligase [Myxococcus stipitatus]AGC43396.1 long-chain-fatty-acid--CoA ligase [Myxococcus stipitatus DSM 14675]